MNPTNPIRIDALPLLLRKVVHGLNVCILHQGGAFRQLSWAVMGIMPMSLAVVATDVRMNDSIGTGDGAVLSKCHRAGF